MKKLMLAAAALMAGFAIADGITSANIVGYTTADAVYGFKAAGSSFAPVAGEDYDIQNLVPIAPAGNDAGGWMFYLMEMNDGGGTAATYVYLTKTADSVAKDGWYDENGEVYITDKTFKLGEGFFFSSDFDPEEYEGENSRMTTSGEVELGEFALDAVYGFAARCNPRPMPANIQDFIPVAPTGADAGGWMFYLMEMNDGGGTSTTYVYLTTTADSVAKDGWYDENGEVYITDKTFQAGEGFFFSSDFDPEEYEGEAAALLYKEVEL